MKKIVFQDEREFNVWFDEVKAYNKQHAYYNSETVGMERPKEYPVMAIYRISSYTVDAHCSPATEYDYILVYPSDFTEKSLDELVPDGIITPYNFDNITGMIISSEDDAVLQENINQVKFENIMRDAEYIGIENFRKAKMAGQNPTKWRIKIDGSVSEHNIKYAVSRYRDAGWKQVSYSYSDKCPGSREPMGQWVITINVKAGK